MNKRKAMFEEILDNVDRYWLEYWKGKQSYSEHVRFGQFVINNYIPTEILPWPDLYYEVSDKEAYDTLRNRMKELINQAANDVWSE